MKQITDYEVHQHLTFLYLAFAHQTDFDLSDKEIKYISKYLNVGALRALVNFRYAVDPVRYN